VIGNPLLFVFSHACAPAGTDFLFKSGGAAEKFIATHKYRDI